MGLRRSGECVHCIHSEMYYRVLLPHPSMPLVLEVPVLLNGSIEISSRRDTRESGKMGAEERKSERNRRGESGAFGAGPPKSF